MYQRLKNTCGSKGITMTQLSNDLNIPPQSLLRWDTNAPSIDRVAKVADYLGVSIDYLYGRTSAEEPKQDVIQQAFERPEMRTLFSMCENAPTEDIEYVIKKLEKLKG